MTEPVLLLAASGLARETLAAIRAIDERDGTSTPVGILDDDEARHGEVLLGSPVLGPPRWTSRMTSGSSVITASPIASDFRQTPGPLVPVTPIAPSCSG